MKNFCVMFIFTFSFITTSIAQEVKWQNTIGGSQVDYLYCIEQTIDGGYILGGFSLSNISGDKSENSYGSSDCWILKTDSAGQIQWQRTIGGFQIDDLNCIKQTTDGGYILGGTSSSNASGVKTENSNGSYDYWIIKVDFMGTIQWQNTIGGNSNDYLLSIQQTTDGGYILGGHSNSSISGDKTENSMGYTDYWIIKIDSIGSIQWQNTIGGSGYDYLAYLHQTTDKGYILGGTSGSVMSGDKTEYLIGDLDYWIIKIDSLGSIQWQNTIGGFGWDFLSTIQLTSDGGYLLGGSSSSNISGDKTENNYSSADYWIVKIDSIGGIKWQNTIGGLDADILNSINPSEDGGYILGGYSYSNISADKVENNIGEFDYWVVKTDSSGTIQWQNTIGGTGGDGLCSIYRTVDNQYVLGGFSRSNQSGDKLENSLGDDDYWILKLTEHYNRISGHFFIDLNNNGIQDGGEPSLSNQKVTEQSTGRFAFSQQNGNYSVAVLDSGSYTVSTPSLQWFSPNPISHSAYFSGILQSDSLNDFAFQPLGVFNDVCVSITPLGQFRSGFPASYQINYGNYGTTTITPTVYFYPDTNVVFQSATLTPTQITPDSVLWSLPAITPFQTGSIIVTVNVDLGLPIGTLINSGAHIEPFLSDDNPSCNNSYWEVFTTGSFDPNDILVDKTELTTTELSTSPWLEYIIRFQNTGNDTAFTVKILNPIDTNKLNLSSIEFVNASHPVNLNWINYQRNMEFRFDNILLPDSNINEPLSHGFVRYRIQPKTTLVAGDTIPNFAAIYFDFNEPVITNTAKTIIVLPTGLASTSLSKGGLLVFPNPTNGNINISGYKLEQGKAQLKISDVYGKLILEKTLTEPNTLLETQNLPSGVYLIQTGAMHANFVKQ